MKYETVLSADVLLLHPSMSVQEIEHFIGMSAIKSHSVGDMRILGDKSVYKNSYCKFQVFHKLVRDPEAALDKCMKILPSAYDNFSMSGGEIWIILKIYDPNFVQLNFDSTYFEELHKLSANLAIENHLPSGK